MIGSFKKKLPIIIHGGGFTGIHLAQRLHNLNIPFKLYEESPQLGGLISEEKTPFGTIYKGPQSLLYKKSIQGLVKTKSFKKGFLFHNSFISLPKISFLLKSIRSIKKESSLRKSLNTIFSDQEISLFIDPILQSIFNQKSEDLSSNLLPKRGIHLLKSVFLQSQESVNGFYQYLLRLSEPFSQNIFLNQTFSEKFTDYNHFFCTPSYKAAEIVPYSELKDILLKFPYSSVTQIHVFFKDNPIVFKEYEGILNSASDFYFTGVFKRKNYYIFFYNETFIDDHFLHDIKKLESKILYEHKQTYEKVFPTYSNSFFHVQEKLQEQDLSNIIFLGNFTSTPGLRSHLNQVHCDKLLEHLHLPLTNQ